MRIATLASIDEVAAAEWNALPGTTQPFLRHEFLAALEHSGSAGAAAGWAPCHLAARDAAGRLVGAMPLYLKTDSWGEFVFDFAWADAYRRAGLRYYPKLVGGVPFTPATGARLLVADGADRGAVVRALVDEARALAGRRRASSLHVLFPDPAGAEELAGAGLLLRKDCQFHWHNRGWASFDEFLGEFTSAKRKKARRERRRVEEAGVSFRCLGGAELDAAAWRELMPLYGSSFWRRGRDPYLNEAFFVEISQRLPESVVVIRAEHAGTPIAVAICFRDATTLYGRYWGSSARFHSLHFETCYYQGIDYCLAEGLARFEPGTQGEHKISRGFVPTETWSAHWLSHPQFFAAVDDYLDRERAYIDDYMDAAREHVPYRRDAV